jgi:aerobic-type carbon monoxide dehydrogenase small subunit (CoxS/CutS family)
MIMSTYDLLSKNPSPDRMTIVKGLENNLCRCGAHAQIIEAVETASKIMKG